MREDIAEHHLFRIECHDIILREFAVSDLEELHSLTWQPEIYQYLPGWNAAFEQRKDWLIHYEIPENKQFLNAVSQGEGVGDLRLRLGIVSKQSGQLIGWCCTGIKDELPAPNREIMYAISKDHRGKGYTTQAVKGLIPFLFGIRGIEMINAVALLDNLPSNRVLQKCGFNFERIIEIGNEHYYHYTLHNRPGQKTSLHPF